MASDRSSSVDGGSDSKPLLPVSSSSSPAPTPPPHSSPALPTSSDSDFSPVNNCLYSKEHPRSRFTNRGDHPYWGLATANHWTVVSRDHFLAYHWAARHVSLLARALCRLSRDSASTCTVQVVCPAAECFRYWTVQISSLPRDALYTRAILECY